MKRLEQVGYIGTMETNKLNSNELHIILDALEDYRRKVSDECEDGDRDESEYVEVSNLQDKIFAHLGR